MNYALVALCGLLINAIVAGPARWYRVLGVGKAARIPDKLLRDIERRLNRADRPNEEREMRGQIVTLAIIIFALVAGFIAGAMFKGLEPIQIIILTFALPVRPIYDRAGAIRKQLLLHHVTEARAALDQNLWRHIALLDEYGLARAAIESLSIGFSEKILSPVFWYVCIGMPGLFITLAVNVMREVLPRPTESSFSKAAEWTYDIWHIIPSRLSALLWLVACLFLPARDIMAALKGIFPRLGTASPQVMALASAASVLRLSLGGPVSAYGNKQWVDTGTPKPVPADIARALYLFALLNLLLFIILGLFL